jgi:hypothetical protein
LIIEAGSWIGATVEGAAWPLRYYSMQMPLTWHLTATRARPVNLNDSGLIDLAHHDEINAILSLFVLIHSAVNAEVPAFRVLVASVLRLV